MSERRHLIEARAPARASQLSLAITLAYFFSGRLVTRRSIFAGGELLLATTII